LLTFWTVFCHLVFAHFSTFPLRRFWQGQRKLGDPDISWVLEESGGSISELSV
jgi:hypothetical protein